MSREKKDAKHLNIKLDRTIHEQLECFCEETEMNKTMAIEKILARFFEEYYKHPEKERVFDK